MEQINFESDSEDEAVATRDAITQVTSMVSLMSNYAVEIGELEDALKKAKEAFTQIEREDLPELMKGFSIKEITLLNGLHVKVENEFACGITEQNKPAAHKWLTDNHFDGIIKTRIEILIPREDREKVAELQQKIAEMEELDGLAVDIDETIHSGTLKSFLKEEREKGTAIPEKEFGIFPYSKAKITAPKLKKMKK